jgi:hypothetical protein
MEAIDVGPGEPPSAAVVELPAVIPAPPGSPGVAIEDPDDPRGAGAGTDPPSITLIAGSPPSTAGTAGGRTPAPIAIATRSAGARAMAIATVGRD